MNHEPTILYLIYNKELNAAKIGVGDITGRRYSLHRSKGWQLVGYWYFTDRQKALDIESKVLYTIRKKLKQESFLSKEQMPQNGYTETFDASKITSRQVKSIIKKQIREQ